ncbi:MAG TPA: DUF1003 domain-containing protein [Bacteroidia bacterium]|jgi:uncharacterized membrane protein|nr:DUF1003 domain-containing protein [Bacteroidia bacterium]
MVTVKCSLCGKDVPENEAIRGELLKEDIFGLITKDHPSFTRNDFVSLEELIPYRKKYLEELIREEIGDLDKLENEVVDAITHNKILSENIEDNLEDKLTIGQRVADKIAEFGGSWTFIICFFSFILGWMALNTYILVAHPFDIYPFMALNLILSCLAAIQAPIIMMSQNRQGDKDRIRSEHDYKINLKAELEIKLLHEKLDHLMIHQNKRLLEIQEVQAEYLEDILKNLREKK